MSHTHEQEEQVRECVLATDVALLNAHNVADSFMSLLASEHAARVEALCKAIDPALGRALLLVTAGALLAAARQIDAATFQEPELTHV